MYRVKLFSYHRWLFIGLIATCALTWSLSSATWADPQGPKESDYEITTMVTRLLKRDHISRHPLDKEISERWFKMFFEDLDPRKMYFYQSDVDEFARQKDHLTELAWNGDVTFAYKVFRRYLQRVDERVQTAEELIAAPHDFTRDENIVVDADELEYPKTPEEARDRLRKQIKLELLLLKTTKDPKDRKEGAEAVKKLQNRYRNKSKWLHQTSDDELLEIYLNALTTSFDPHTGYLSPETQKNFEILMRLELEGIGATLQSSDGETIIKDLVPGGAAAKSGLLHVEDKIVGVGQGEEGPIVDVVDMKLNNVVKLIRGTPGTTVRLEIVPADNSGQKVIKIVREKIELKDSEAKGKVFEVGRRPDGKPYKIGVIDLPSFYGLGSSLAINALGGDVRITTEDVRAILNNFKKQGVDAVVLDLRFNGGGLLKEAINLTGLFLHRGPVVQVKDADGQIEPCEDNDPSMTWNGPLIVVVNKFSASASEILAGAIQDYGRGLIVGDPATHGKGTVQSLRDLAPMIFSGIYHTDPLGALKITMQQFYRPSGDSTQKRGVLSDIVLPSLTSQYEVGEGDLDYPLEFDKVPSQDYQRFSYVTSAVRDQLKKLSASRVQHSENFQKLEQMITRRKEQKEQKVIPLNEEKYLAYRGNYDSDAEEKKIMEVLSNPSGQDTIERDFYLDEVLAIAVDYLNLRQVAQTQ
ncbi:MAG: carboxy terminal-processing peptidase [Pirellulales bacterium]|nr:carboxy terminal-processing peptidase [Pirellulales bacterium]